MKLCLWAARASVLGLLLGLTAACSGMKLDPQPPPKFDLSGNWRLVPDQSDRSPGMRELRDRGVGVSFAAQDFPVLGARTMRIQQDHDSMGIRFDNGDYRDVTWGSRQRGLWNVDAGWNEGKLYILSEARDAKAKEMFSLEDSNQVLVVVVELKSRGKISVTRVFRRG